MPSSRTEKFIHKYVNNPENAYEIGKEIVSLRFRVTNIRGMSNWKKNLVAKTLDFVICLLNDDDKGAINFLDLVNTIFGRKF